MKGIKEKVMSRLCQVDKLESSLPFYLLFLNTRGEKEPGRHAARCRLSPGPRGSPFTRGPCLTRARRVRPEWTAEETRAASWKRLWKTASPFNTKLKCLWSRKSAYPEHLFL